MRRSSSRPVVFLRTPPHCLKLEEERYVLLGALVSDRAHPPRTDRPGPAPALAPDDDPVDAIEIEFADVLEQGLDAQEPNRCRGLAQLVHTGRQRKSQTVRAR